MKIVLIITIKIALKNVLKNYVRNRKEMSLLKISDPVKRDLIIKEYLELKKNIRDNLLSQKTGEQQLQTDLSKFYRPITETQKATTRAITERLKPIKEGIEKLPQAKEELPGLGEIASMYLYEMFPVLRDRTFGIREIGKGNFYIGSKTATIDDNDIIIDDEKFEGTPGLWELLMSKQPEKGSFSNKDPINYGRLMVKTNALHRNYDPNSPYPRASDGFKWMGLLRHIWYEKEEYEKEYEEVEEKEYEGKGVVVIPSDPNTFLERLDLLLASQEAGHTGVGNELVSICDELKRQGVLNSMSYKNFISNIKK